MYCSEQSLVWFRLIYSKRSESILAYISTTNWWNNSSHFVTSLNYRIQEAVVYVLKLSHLGTFRFQLPAIDLKMFHQSSFCNRTRIFVVNFNILTCAHKLEFFRQAFISSAGVDLGIIGNVCLKSPASNINVLPKGLDFPRKSFKH